jgi:hypothetical protein
VKSEAIVNYLSNICLQVRSYISKVTSLSFVKLKEICLQKASSYSFRGWMYFFKAISMIIPQKDLAQTKLAFIEKLSISDVHRSFMLYFSIFVLMFNSVRLSFPLLLVVLFLFV